jgi:hypothetical protein
MNWRHDSSSRAPALQAQDPEFKLWAHPNKIKQSKTDLLSHCLDYGHLAMCTLIV